MFHVTQTQIDQFDFKEDILKLDTSININGQETLSLRKNTKIYYISIITIVEITLKAININRHYL